MIQLAKDILDPNQLDYFARHGSIDFAYDYRKAGDEDGSTQRRFRVNLFMARGNPSLAARLITSQIKKFEELYLPPILGDVAMAAQGLILFSGVTGSGNQSKTQSIILACGDYSPWAVVNQGLRQGSNPRTSVSFAINADFRHYGKFLTGILICLYT